MSQKAGSAIRIADDIAEVLPVKLAERRVKLTPLINAFLRAWVADPGSTTALRATGPPADAVKFRKAAVAARQLAAQLEALAGDAPESEPTLTISYSALISMIQEIRKNGPDTSDSPTNEDLAQRVRARLGEDSAAPASDNSGTVRGPGRKRSAAG